MLAVFFFFFSRFLGSDDKQNYFTSNQRSRVVWEILSTTTYGKKKKAEIGIERLIEDDVFIGAYPLHDVNIVLLLLLLFFFFFDFFFYSS